MIIIIIVQWVSLKDTSYMNIKRVKNKREKILKRVKPGELGRNSRSELQMA